MKLTKAQLKEMHELEEAGYIRIRKHPQFPIYIANYTHMCQFDRKWNDITMMCRGLIYGEDGEIIARPFKKFFNVGEGYEPEKPAPPLPDEDYAVYEKLDGSLGILYWWEGKPYIATRGSFESEQAQMGQKILDRHIMHEDGEFLENLEWFEEHGITLLWEIIYPENQIVVSYFDKKQLVLIGKVKKEDGRSQSFGESEYDWMGTLISEIDIFCDCVDVVQEYGDRGKGISMEEMAKPRENCEGYVLLFTDSDLRVKIKHEEYSRLHRLITGVNERRIWEVLAAGDPLDFMLKSVPDEFYKFVKEVSERLNAEYDDILADAKKYVLKAKKKKDRASQAQVIKKCKCPAAGFNLLDGKPPCKSIWAMLKPKTNEEK